MIVADFRARRTTQDIQNEPTLVWRDILTHKFMLIWYIAVAVLFVAAAVAFAYYKYRRGKTEVLNIRMIIMLLFLFNAVIHLRDQNIFYDPYADIVKIPYAKM